MFQNLSCTFLLLQFINELKQEKSPITVHSVEKPFVKCLVSRHTRWSILGKSHVSVLHVGRVWDVAQISLSMRSHISPRCVWFRKISNLLPFPTMLHFFIIYRINSAEVTPWCLTAIYFCFFWPPNGGIRLCTLCLNHCHCFMSHSLDLRCVMDWRPCWS